MSVTLGIIPEGTTLSITKDENSSQRCKGIKPIGNDPTAGSPTVTLLRLVLPLNDQV